MLMDVQACAQVLKRQPTHTKHANDKGLAYELVYPRQTQFLSYNEIWNNHKTMAAQRPSKRESNYTVKTTILRKKMYYKN